MDLFTDLDLIDAMDLDVMAEMIRTMADTGLAQTIKNFDEVGNREINRAADLIELYRSIGDKTKRLGSGVSVKVCKVTGDVWLEDVDGNQAQKCGDDLEDYVICPGCDYQGLLSEFQERFCGLPCCEDQFGEYFNELGQII